MIHRSEVISIALGECCNLIYSGRRDKALVYLRHILECDPKCEVAQQLLTGSLDMEATFGKKWLGESLDGKEVIVYANQGLGDTIQFVRFLKVLKSMWDCKVVFSYIKISPINELLLATGWIDEIAIPRRADYCTNLFMIPRILTGAAEGEFNHYYPEVPIEVPIPYLSTSKAAYLKSPSVALAWSGNTRQYSLEDFRFLSEVANVYGLHPGSQGDFLQEINIGSFCDVAAIINSADMVVSIDTGALHLAGAMGARAIGIVGEDRDPRWGKGDSTQWYPSIRLMDTIEQEAILAALGG